MLVNLLLNPLLWSDRNAESCGGARVMLDSIFSFLNFLAENGCGTGKFPYPHLQDPGDDTTVLER
jgi:hypothetical protein